MQAIVVSAPGGPEVLELRSVAEPTPGEGEVLVEVRATALNRVDILQRKGLYPPPPGASEILGLECAGVVSALGAGTATTSVGERVMALLTGGGYAERVVVPERMLMAIPERLSFEEAAAVPEAFLTASEALFGVGRLAPGEWVLIHAAASGVGSAAIQLAREAGARVVGTASGKKLPPLAGLGAERLVDRTSEDFSAIVLEVTDGRGADVILDFVGAAYAARHAACLATLGRHVVLGLLGGAKAEVDLGRLLARRQSLLGLVMRSRPLADRIRVVERFRREWLHRLADGRLAPVIDCVLPLAEAARAHARMEANENVGKLVLTLGAS